ncbi:inositol monophosphatase family protein [Fodinicurvata halophila]|uniref:Inositol monophosphatase family protein n=1 Tax=Fodinicurvata halophila TaxID=1419723 RepID=A0ABV8ULJ9_9PROT
MPAFDPERVAELVRQAAAEFVLPRFRRLEKGDVREKLRGELVTVADLDVETFLSEKLRTLWPGSVVVGEESSEDVPEGLEELRGEKPVWIIDPVDGTANFAAGNDCFAIMIALAERRSLRAAWIYAPVQDVMLHAEAGQGSWRNGKRLCQLQSAASNQDLCGTLHFGTYGNPELVRRFERNRRNLRTLKSLRCSGHEYLRLVSGESSFSLFTRTKPWDHAPGVLIYRELGGQARHLPEGQDYDVGSCEPGPLLLAPDAASWKAVKNRLLAT